MATAIIDKRRAGIAAPAPAPAAPKAPQNAPETPANRLGSLHEGYGTPDPAPFHKILPPAETVRLVTPQEVETLRQLHARDLDIRRQLEPYRQDVVSSARRAANDAYAKNPSSENLRKVESANERHKAYMAGEFNQIKGLITQSQREFYASEVAPLIESIAKRVLAEAAKVVAIVEEQERTNADRFGVGPVQVFGGEKKFIPSRTLAALQATLESISNSTRNIGTGSTVASALGWMAIDFLVLEGKKSQ